MSSSAIILLIIGIAFVSSLVFHRVSKWRQWRRDNVLTPERELEIHRQACKDARMTSVPLCWSYTMGSRAHEIYMESFLSARWIDANKRAKAQQRKSDACKRASRRKRKMAYRGLA